MPIIKGTLHADDLSGTPGDDVIYAGGGNDYVHQTSPKNVFGNDTIYGSTGNDTILAGSYGDKWVVSDSDPHAGPQGDDHVFTGAGNDRVWAGGGSDFVYTGKGDDTLHGGQGSDQLYGDRGNDVYAFEAGDGKDTIEDKAGTKDMIVLSSELDFHKVAFFRKGNDLDIQYTNGDTIHVRKFFTTGTIETLRLGGHTLTSGDINGIVNNISSYATSHGISLHNVSDVYNNSSLMSLVTGAHW